MNTFVNILTSKATWVVVGMFVLAVLLSTFIEKKVENDFAPLLGVIPSLVIWYFYFVKSTGK